MHTYTLENTEALVALVSNLCSSKGHCPKEIFSWDNGHYIVAGQLAGYDGPWDGPEDVAHIYVDGVGVGKIDVFGTELISFAVANWNGEELNRKVVA
nr:MAG TPA: hypothetical protein [Caudoviricetes sp.]